MERMARAWCQFNGWVPEHRPIVWKPSGDWKKHGKPRFEEVEGDPIWKAHMRAMDHILKAIGE